MTNHLQIPPEHGDGSTLDSPSNTLDMPLFSRSQDLAGMDMSSALLSGPFGTNPALLSSYTHHDPGSSNPLEQWYARNDGPWIPKDLAPPDAQNGLNSSITDFMFTGPYRESISPSECDTNLMPSDSGYGSHVAKHSVATASCYDDSLESHETQSLTGQFASFNVDQRQWSQCPPMLHRPSQSDVKKLVCETCNKELKTNSELKKHQQRHTKPHICNVQGCTRVGGFSTSNDLDRHKRSVHPGEFANGNRYNCTLQACRNKHKIWPRADNFRAHIKRCHGQVITDEDLEKFMIRSTTPQDVLPDMMQHPSVDHDFQMESSQHFTTTYWHQEMNSDSTIDLPQNPSSHQPLPSSHLGHRQQVINQANTLARLENQSKGQFNLVKPRSSLENVADSSHHLNGRFSGVQKPDRSCDQRFLSHGSVSSSTISGLIDNQSIASHSEARELMVDASDSDSEDVATPQSYENEEKMTRDSANAAIPTADDLSSLVLKLRDHGKLKEVLEKLQSNGLLKELGYRKEETPDSEEKASEAPGSRKEGHNSCHTCGKDFTRPCELKKHMKRHEKPYGCTFGGCNKRFGSKNDWKRHENSQHFLLDFWHCDVRTPEKPSAACGKVSHRRETFRHHLANSHGLAGDIIDKKLEECRVGRNCEANFWCGFCMDIIKIKGKGLNAWTERYNHIDDHLSGRNDLSKKDMDDWKSVSPEAQHLTDSLASKEEVTDTSTRSVSSMKETTPSTDDVVRDIDRNARPKRKANGLGDARHAKRLKNTKQDDIRLVETNSSAKCCICGEYNVRSKLNLYCINNECQHPLCNNCGQ